MSEVNINYKGSTIASMDASGTKTLQTSGKYCEDDVEVVYTRPTAPTPTYQTKSVTPSESAQTVTADSGYDALEEVDVGAISSTYVGSGITRRSSTDLTASGATVTVPAGFYESQASKAVSSGTAGTPTATKGTVSNHAVSVTPSVTNTTGYITGSTKTGTAVSVAASELVSGTKSIAANGTTDVTNYKNVSVSVTPNLREVTVTPTSSLQVLTPNSGALVGNGTTAEHYINSTPRQEPLNGLGVVLTEGVTYEVSGTYSLRSNMGVTKSGTISGQTQLSANMLSNVTSGEIATYISLIKLSNISSQTYVVFDTSSTYSEYYVSFALTIYETISGNYDGFSKVTIDAAGVGTKAVTNSSATATSLEFSGLSGAPKAFFIRLAGALTRNSSNSYYYITDIKYDGSATKGNYWRMSTGNFYNDTSRYSFTYSNGTLTVTSSGTRGSAGGSFYNGTYELVYVY